MLPIPVSFLSVVVTKVTELSVTTWANQDSRERQLPHHSFVPYTLQNILIARRRMFSPGLSEHGSIIPVSAAQLTNFKCKDGNIYE